MRDQASNIGVVQAVAPAVLSATNTADPIDLIGFNAATVVINTGAIVSSGDFTAKLQESEDGSTGWADVAAAHLSGSFPASLEANATVKVGYIGYRRYVRMVLTKNSGTSIAAGVTIVKGHPADAPVT
ncbi:hypothetical protein [Roseovarius sp.]|uniref:hypothetical protein n=1 Tax=Roseovarius sp. TaxID=1486281 RepID=UPI00260D4352|nr:hypothetical protein [Roseovarius sp.]MDM8167159.1 hypothetical protein [Roseovarius sp.]